MRENRALRKPGMPEYHGIWRNITEYAGISRNMPEHHDISMVAMRLFINMDV
jgi:hypothetical protein